MSLLNLSLSPPEFLSHLYSRSYHPISLKSLPSSNFTMKYQGACQWGSNILSLSISSDNLYIVSGSSDGLIRLWSLHSFSLLSTFFGHTHWVTCISFSPDNSYLISGSYDMTLKIWNLHTARCINTLTESKGSILGLCCNEEYLVCGSIDLVVRLYRYKKWTLCYEFKGHSDWICSVALSYSRELVVSGSGDNTVKIWSIRKKTLESTLAQGNSGCTCVVISKDDEYIISGYENGIIRVWNLHTSVKVYAYKPCDLPINSLSISNNSDYVISCARDGSYTVWNITHRRRVIHNKLNWGVNVVQFTGDNKYCLMGCVDTTIQIYQIL